MKRLTTFLALLSLASLAVAGEFNPPAPSASKQIAEVHYGYEAANTWHTGGNFVQAKTTDGKYFVYYVGRPNCSESGAKFVMTVLLAAKAMGSPVKFNATMADASDINNANNAAFRDVFLLE